ncbi:unnamed protein product [Brassica oleracea var. botrytis]|uniref:Uncharacterized protein n=1 Tax=Brassica oleracea TaxID=3712 RepID=A0A3P6AY89_BRAOL|nr:unnamed protein product [Brassica oleracea]
MSKPWNLKEKDDDKVVFDTSGDMLVSFDNSVENVRRRRDHWDYQRSKPTTLLAAFKFLLQRSFGDLIAKSGITAEMLDSLIALKDFQGVDGLPPLSEIENIRREKSSKNLQELRQNSRFERRLPNQDKEFDVYFSILDHRAALLRPLAETKTLAGHCKTRNQICGQHFKLDMFQMVFLTRNSKVMGRKKHGKAKATKIFPMGQALKAYNIPSLLCLYFLCFMY